MVPIDPVKMMRTSKIKSRAFIGDTVVAETESVQLVSVILYSQTPKQRQARRSGYMGSLHDDNSFCS